VRGPRGGGSGAGGLQAPLLDVVGRADLGAVVAHVAQRGVEGDEAGLLVERERVRVLADLVVGLVQVGGDRALVGRGGRGVEPGVHVRVRVPAVVAAAAGHVERLVGGGGERGGDPGEDDDVVGVVVTALRERRAKVVGRRDVDRDAELGHVRGEQVALVLADLVAHGVLQREGRDRGAVRGGELAAGGGVLEAGVGQHFTIVNH